MRHTTRWSLTQRDLLYLVETLMPNTSDVDEAAARLRSDEALLAAMLDDEDLFDRLLGATREQNREAADVIAERNSARGGVSLQNIQGFEATSRRVWEQLVGVLYERELLDELTAVVEASRN